MSRPARYHADDPYLAEVRRICLAFPGALERVSHGMPNWYTTKTFVTFGAVEKGSHASTRWAQSIQVLPDPAERTALEQDPRFFTPAYTGPYGWLGLDLAAMGPADSVDWNEVRELVDTSYRLTAPRRLVAMLDGENP